MAIFLSAGHNLKDPGAVAGGTTEAAEMMELRDRVIFHIGERAKVIRDLDSETLGQYLTRIQTGSGSVVLELHMDAAGTATATGATAVIGDDADGLDKRFAEDLARLCSGTLGIRNRGVITESKTHRGRLGLMRETGIVALLEVCFISNPSDLQAYRDNREVLAAKLADILVQYDALV